jgi:hypothetical protein
MKPPPGLPQAEIVFTLVLELARAAQEEVSARSLADVMSTRFPSVPRAFIRAIAQQVLRLAFDPDAISPEDIGRAAESPEEAAGACRWVGEAMAGEVASLICLRIAKA